MRQTKFPAAFTIIEMIMVILLISVLAVVIIPRTVKIHPFRLDGAAQKMLSDMKYAQRLAMARHQIYGVSFKPPQERYIVYQGSEAAPVDDPFRPGNDLIVDYDDEKQFRGVDLHSAGFGGGMEVRFDSFGVPLDGSDVPLGNAGSVVLRCGGKEVTIQVTPSTGKVEVIK